MSESFGLVHSVLAPIFTKIAKEEQRGWDQSRKKHAAAHRGPEAAPASEAGQTDGDASEEALSSTHIDLRI